MIDNQVIIVELSCGGLISIHLSMYSPEYKREINLQGLCGLVRCDFNSMSLKLYKKSNIDNCEEFNVAPYEHTISSLHTFFTHQMMKKVNDCLRSRGRCIQYPILIRDALFSTLLCLKIEQARIDTSILDLKSTWDLFNKFFVRFFCYHLISSTLYVFYACLFCGAYSSRLLKFKKRVSSIQIRI